MKEYLEMWQRYCDFSGSTGVRGYWMAVLFNFLVGVLIGIGSTLTRGGIFALISMAYSLAVLLPSLGLTVRRLRDAGKEWYWIFVALIPLVGWVWLIILLCKPSVFVFSKES